MRHSFVQGAFDRIQFWFHNGFLMVTLTVKNIPDGLHGRLRRRAKAHGRSLNKEIIASLERVTSPRRLEIPEYLSRVERVQEKIDFEVTIDEIQQGIEGDRP